MTSLRQQFADLMVDIGTADPRVVVLVGDISHGILQPFAEACPDRYYNIGICEPTMVNMAAGLNRVGLIPFVHTIAPFITERAYEQIKLDFGYQRLSLNLVSVGSSFDYSQLGCSHHCYTDVSILSHLAAATVMLPSSATELEQLLRETYAQDGIKYFRLPENTHDVDLSVHTIEAGKGIRVREGDDITIATTGPQLRNAVSAAAELSNAGVECDVLYFHTMKPFDAVLVLESTSKTRRLITIEELSAHDGLYNQCIRAAATVPLLSEAQLAVEDFIHEYGTYEQLCGAAGLTSDALVSRTLDLIRDHPAMEKL